MKYTLQDLLADKELRKSLIENTFSFADENGDFFAVDFQNESMRQNHITVFEVLYSLGGDELFEKLLADGNTCLTKDPKAAKVGVQAVAGAEGWYLKTNASSVAAFSSILNGLSGLELDERFSFSVQEESTTTHIVSSLEYSYATTFGLEISDTEIEKREDGRFVIKNTDENAVISFSVLSEQNATIEFDSFYALEPFYRKEEVYNEEIYDFESVDFPFAYKYQLEEDGNWGYFNLAFSQLIPPSFEDIILTKNDGAKTLIAWEKRGFFDSDGYLFYFGEYGSLLDSGSELNISRAYQTDCKGFPTESAYVERNHLFQECAEIICYVPQQNLCEGYVFSSAENCLNSNKFSVPTTPGHHVEICQGVLQGEKTKRRLAVADDVIHACDCGKLYFGEANEHQVAYRLTEDNYYAVERDAYYAIAKFTDVKEQFSFRFSGELDFVELLTPYAFTSIHCGAEEGYAVVERFGKQGLFNLKTKKYVLPCDYDRIGILYGNTYRVRKVDFYGTISVQDGQVKWTERLHREE